jgi:micrococcal nuclease
MDINSLYTYRAKMTRVIDGDTVVVDLDLGLNIKINNFKIRLSRINAPELRGEFREDGLRSMRYLRRFVGQRRAFYIETLSDKKDKYGRYLGELYVYYGDKCYNVNDRMLEKGYASLYKGNQLEDFEY